MPPKKLGRYTACLTLDKTTYRPKETVYGRVLLIEATSKQPLEQSLHFTLSVVSPRGEVVHSTGVSGASLGFSWQLPEFVPGGEYQIRAVSEALSFSATRTFFVKNYRAPRLRKELTFLQKAYGPGDEVIASCQVSRAEGGLPENASALAVASVDGQEIYRETLMLTAEGLCQMRFSLPAEIKEGEGTLNVVVSDGGVQESIAKTIPLVIQKLSLIFYPEGGDLIRGLTNRLYFEAKASTGKPADVTGRIISKEGKTLALFSSAHEGRGVVSLFVPEDFVGGAVVDAPFGVTQLFSLEPPASWEPLLLAERERFATLSSCQDAYPQGEPIRLRIQSKRKAKLRLVLSSRAEKLAETEVSFSEAGDQEASLSVPSDFLGVLQATLFSEASPVAERLCFVSPSRQVSISLTASKPKATPRNVIEVKVKTCDAQTQTPISARVGLMVVDDAVLTLTERRERQPRLPAQALLEGDVEKLEDAEAYLPLGLSLPGPELSPQSASKRLDLLLGTQGWRRFLLVGVEAPPPPPEAPNAPQEPPTAFSWSSLWGRLADLPWLRQLLGNRPNAALEDPSKLLQQVILEMNEQLVHSKKATAEAIAEEKRLAKQLNAATINSHEWGTKAALAFKAGNVALTQEALERKAGFDKFIAKYQQEHQLQKEAVEKLKSALRALQNKIDEARRKKDLLIARRRRAEAQRSIQATMNGLTDTSAFDTFDRMAQKVDQLEAEAEAQADLESVLGGSPENRFAALEGNSALDDALATLKAKMGLAPLGTEAQDAKLAGASAPPRAIQFQLVREYAHLSTPSASEARDLFVETLFFHSGLRTNQNGEASILFELSDSITTYRVMADAITEGGVFGVADTCIEVQKPFYLETRLPFEVSAGDTCQIPIMMVNATETNLSPALSVEVSGALSAKETLSSPDVPAQSRQALFAPLFIGNTPGELKLTVSGEAGAYKDRVTRSLSVVPQGFPWRIARSGVLKTRIEETFIIPEEALPGSTGAALVLHDNPLSLLERSLSSMLREPYGCFEQASATTYPNVMILTYLSQKKVASPEASQKALSLIESGYQRLLSYECKGGGFEWFGKSPAHEALSAYGLMEFYDMAKVYPVEPALLSRTREWLLSRRDGQGGFHQAPGKYAFSNLPAAVVDSYVTWALCRVGLKGLSLELALAKKRALESKDPYLVALAANAFLCAQEPAEELLSLLASLQSATGAFLGAKTSITKSYGHSLQQETTALSAMALFAAGQLEPASRAVLSLLQAPFYSTQSTVLGLQAVMLWLKEGAPSQAEPQVSVDGAPQMLSNQKLILSSLQPGTHTLVIEAPQEASWPYHLEVAYRSLLPESSEACRVALSAALSSSEATEGDALDLLVELTNKTEEGLPMVVAILGLPGGVEPHDEQLKELREKGAFDFFELRGRELVLYWRGMPPKERAKLRLSLTASIPGRYTAPASRAYLYYGSEDKHWVTPLAIEIKPRPL